MKYWNFGNFIISESHLILGYFLTLLKCHITHNQHNCSAVVDTIQSVVVSVESPFRV
jgi:hypothetical protein